MKKQNRNSKENNHGKEKIPYRFVIALEIAIAVQTPLPEPDMSSPSNTFANLSFIISVSILFHKAEKRKIKLKKKSVSDHLTNKSQQQTVENIK